MQPWQSQYLINGLWIEKNILPTKTRIFYKYLYFKCLINVKLLVSNARFSVSIGPTYNQDSYTIYKVNLNYSTISTTITHSNIPPCLCTIYYSSKFCTHSQILSSLQYSTKSLFCGVYFLSSSLIILYLISTIFWQSRPLYNIKTGCNNCSAIVEPIKLGL